MPKSQNRVRGTVRPDIRVPRTDHAEVRDLADELGVDWRDLYVEIIRAGLEEVRERESQDSDVDDVRAVAEEISPTDSKTTTDSEVEAFVAIWEYIQNEGEASPKDIREAVHADHPAGHEIDWWWKKLGPHVEELPGVERASQRRFIANS